MRYLVTFLVVGRALSSTIVFCPPSQLAPGDLLKVLAHDAPSRFPCARPLVRIDAWNRTLEEWNGELLRILLRRRRMTYEERRAIKVRLTEYEKSWAGAREVGGRVQSYILLKHTLHTALQDPAFTRLSTQERGLWLEFGVLTGLSINITSAFVEKGAYPGAIADGFDTFTGLPEAWPNGKGGFCARYACMPCACGQPRGVPVLDACLRAFVPGCLPSPHAET